MAGTEASHPAGPLRYIQVGIGGWGEHWCRDTLPPLARRGLAVPAAVVDVDASRHAIAQDALGVPADRCYTSLDKALAEVSCDFVIVIVPPAWHEQAIRVAVAHGKHVLCEKPLADSLEACVRISDLAAAAGIKLAVTMSHRFDQDKQTLQACVTSGVYGELSYLVYRFTTNHRAFGSWGEFRHQMPDPLLIEGSVHHFDVLRALSGADARTVYAVSWNPRWGEYAGDSTALIVLEMTNGVRCLYEGAKANASTLNGWGEDYIRAECEFGTLELDRRQLTGQTSGPDSSSLVSHRIALRTSRPQWRNGAIAEDFCGWLSGGPPAPTRHEDNLQCSALLFAAIESARTRRAVDVQEFLAAARSRVAQAGPVRSS